MAESKNKTKIKDFIEKIKSIKHIEIIIGVIAVALMIIIFAGVGGKSVSSEENDVKESVSEEQQSVSVSELEGKLAAVLSDIEGVGKSSVLITTKSSGEKITANTVTTNTSTSQSGSGNVTSTTSSTESPIIVNNSGKSEPYVVKELMPEILGVIVVAEGPDNAVTRLAIMRAVQAVLQVSASCVEIYPMK